MYVQIKKYDLEYADHQFLQEITLQNSIDHKKKAFLIPFIKEVDFNPFSFV